MACDYSDKAHHQWDPAHTGALLQYIAAHPLRKVVAGFEFGNEPRSEKYGFRLTGAMLGQDIIQLRQMVDEIFRSKAGDGPVPMLLGPDQDQDQDCVVPQVHQHPAVACAL